MTIGVSELQKNISIFKNLTESIHIIDKKTKEVLALVLPKSQMEEHTLTDTLAGSLQVKNPIYEHKNFDTMVEDAYEQEMKEKYGF